MYGDRVFFKRKMDEKWYGPGTIIGVASSVQFVRHGRQMLRIHGSDLQPADERMPGEGVDMSDATAESNSNPLNEFQKYGERTCQYEESVPCSYQKVTDKDEGNAKTRDDSARAQCVQADKQEVCSEIQPNKDKRNNKPKNNKVIELVISKDVQEGIFKAQVLSSAGKAAGKWMNCCNIRYLVAHYVQGQERSLEFNLVDSWNYSDTCLDAETESNKHPETEVMFSELQELDAFEEAKQQELNNWKHFEVYKEVNEKAECMTTRWVFTMRKNADGAFVPDWLLEVSRTTNCRNLKYSRQSFQEKVSACSYLLPL